MAGEIRERRKTEYAFSSREKLVSFFSQWMEEDAINNILDQIDNEFIERKDSSDKETLLQYLKKCQYALMEHMGSEIQIQ